LKSLKTLKLQAIIIVHIAVFMFKYYHNLLPPLFDGFFSLNADVHSYYTVRIIALFDSL